jgi:hypothetical protein
MAETSGRESFKVNLEELGDRLTKLVHEGNVRRVIVKRDAETIAEFPLTVGVVGAVLAPPLAAIGAIVALVANCTIEVERAEAAEHSEDNAAG